MKRNTSLQTTYDQQRLNELILIELREIKKYLEFMPTRIKILQKAYKNPAPRIKKKYITVLTSTSGIHAPHKLKKGSELYRIREILLKKNSAAHVTEIMSYLGYSDKKKKVSLVGSLNQYAKKGRVFTKTDRNTFGLIELLNGIG